MSGVRRWRVRLRLYYALRELCLPRCFCARLRPLVPVSQIAGGSGLALRCAARVAGSGARVSFGPRPSGSEAWRHGKVCSGSTSRRVVAGRGTGFPTNTPRGPITFRNIIARTRPGCPPRLIVGGHYDTKWMPRMRSWAPTTAVPARRRCWKSRARCRPAGGRMAFVWFDGEECVGEITTRRTVSTASTHLVRKLFEQKQLRQIQAASCSTWWRQTPLLTIPRHGPARHAAVQHVFARRRRWTARIRRTDGPLDVRRSHAFVWNGVAAID